MRESRAEAARVTVHLAAEEVVRCCCRGLCKETLSFIIHQLKLLYLRQGKGERECIELLNIELLIFGKFFITPFYLIAIILCING